MFILIQLSEMHAAGRVNNQYPTDRETSHLFVNDRFLYDGNMSLMG